MHQDWQHEQVYLQSTFPSMVDSLQISEGAVARVKADDQYSVEVQTPTCDSAQQTMPSAGAFNINTWVQISERDIKQLSILGEGASGRVYKALFTKAGQATPPRFVAVKRISGLDSVRFS